MFLTYLTLLGITYTSACDQGRLYFIYLTVINRPIINELSMK